MYTHPRSCRLAAAFLAFLPLPVAAQSPEPPAKSLLIAGDVFAVGGRTAFLILPPKSESRDLVPWVWHAPTLPGNAEKWMFGKFVAAGIAIAGVDVESRTAAPPDA